MEPSLSRQRLIALITGYILSQAVHCVAVLRIADRLLAGPRTAAELAKEAGCSAPHLARLMRTLCSIGVFEETVQGFALNDAAHYLRKEVEGSAWPLASLHGQEMYSAFSGLLDNVRTGAPAWTAVMGRSVWDYLLEHPARAEIFDAVMCANHEDDVERIVSACDFSGVSTVVDVGGGDGSLLRAILARHEDLRAILFDLSAVIARSRASHRWGRLLSRCQFESGDFFEDVPAGGDVYLLRHVLHDWDDEQCGRLLGRCRDAMHEEARLLIIESVSSAGRDMRWTRCSDLGVMVIGGQERGFREYTQLLSAVGLFFVRSISGVGRYAIIEARVA